MMNVRVVGSALPWVDVAVAGRGGGAVGEDARSPIVGALIRQRRLAVGWAQQDLATRAGVSVRTVRNIELDRITRPRTASVQRLLATLGVPEGGQGFAGGCRTTIGIGVLGPLSLHRGGMEVRLQSKRLQGLLGLLAIQPGATVGRDEIVDVLWGTHPPRTCLALVNTYVARLRGALEPQRSAGRPARTVVRAGGGYLLDVEPRALDLARFDDLLRRGLAARASGDLPAAWRLLEQALDCWRGPVLAGVGAQLAQHPAAVAAAHRRLAAASAFADVGLALVEPDRLVVRLRPVVADEPLHEGVHARLMLALAGSGQQADALAVFASLRTRLADELGIEPGSEVQDAHLRVLRQEVLVGRVPDVGTASAGTADVRPGADTAQTAPLQLPAAVPAFVGRAVQLRRMDDLVRDAAGEGPVVCAITGTGGVGKTTLAVQWAHRNVEWFPDGQLYVNLRGFDPAVAPTDPGEVIRDFLAALDVPPERIPPSVQAQAGLYRSRLAGRRLLLVLDNARDADQVRPLLPGAAGVFVLVTSRNQLTSLLAGGAHPITVDLLSDAEAVSLLTHRLGARRVAAEPVAVRQIVERCARLPLAITVAAARIAGHARFPLGDLAAELHHSQRGLDALDGGDADTDVRAVLASSYHHLDAPHARLFRLLGLNPGPDIAAPVAAGLAGTSEASARSALSVLARANLITEHVPGRFGLHDLLRRYAEELVQAEEAEPQRRAAILRLTQHYVLAAECAAAQVEPVHPTSTARPPADTVRVSPRTPDGALQWYDAERQSLLGCLRLAAANALDREVGSLTGALTELFDRRGHWHDWAAATGRALEAARRLGDDAMLARLHRSRGRAEVWLRNPAQAREHLRRAVDLFRSIGDRIGLAHTYRTFAWFHGGQGDRRRAVGYARKAVALHQAAGDRAGQGLGLNTLGWQHAHLGEYAIALRCCREAVTLLSDAGDRNGMGYALDSLGYIHLRLGDHAEAMENLRRAVALFRQTGDLYQEADTLVRLGEAAKLGGSVDAAQLAWRQAADILQALHHPDAEEVRARLSRQPVPGRTG
jgi:DNA-binding SARP family transcriptional activator/tetratricopeptide (TPR) repeat protein